MFKLILAIAGALILSPANPLGAQPIKMTIGQTGVIDQLLKEGYFKY